MAPALALRHEGPVWPRLSAAVPLVWLPEDTSVYHLASRSRSLLERLGQLLEALSACPLAIACYAAACSNCCRRCITCAACSESVEHSNHVEKRQNHTVTMLHAYAAL